jgi:hypothetical protein
MTGRKIGIVLICLLECAILSFAFIHPVRIYSGGAVSGRAVQESEPDGGAVHNRALRRHFYADRPELQRAYGLPLLRKVSPQAQKNRVDDIWLLLPHSDWRPFLQCAAEGGWDKPVFACDLNGIIEFLHNKTE